MIKLEKELDKIRDFITPSSNQFGGAFLSTFSPFDFDCSNSFDTSENCYNIEFDSESEILILLEDLLIDTESKETLIKRFLKESKYNKDDTKYLHIYRRF